MAVAAGGASVGIIGAVFAVPLLAFINTTVLYLKGYDSFIRLNYQQDRPGGPPGLLDKELVESSRPSDQNLSEAREAKALAEKNGENKTPYEHAKKAEKVQLQIQDALSEFASSDPNQTVPGDAKTDFEVGAQKKIEDTIHSQKVAMTKGEGSEIDSKD